MIIYGKRLCGRVDNVPGILYVATQFFHLYFIPIAPLDSFIILEGTESKNGFRGVKTSFSLKSIGVTYARTVLWILGLLMVSQATCRVATPGAFAAHGGSLGWVGVLTLGTVLLVILVWPRRVLRATNDRAFELARKVGIPEETIAALVLERKHHNVE